MSRHPEGTTSEIMIKEARSRIESLVDRAEKAQEEINDVLRLIPCWIDVYEDLSGEKFPQEILRQAGIAIERPKRRAKANAATP